MLNNTTTRDTINNLELEKLSNDILLYIFLFLDPKNYNNIKKVCKRFYNLPTYFPELEKKYFQAPQEKWLEKNRYIIQKQLLRQQRRQYIHSADAWQKRNINNEKIIKGVIAAKDPKHFNYFLKVKQTMQDRKKLKSPVVSYCTPTFDNAGGMCASMIFMTAVIAFLLTTGLCIAAVATGYDYKFLMYLSLGSGGVLFLCLAFSSYTCYRKYKLQINSEQLEKLNQTSPLLAKNHEENKSDKSIETTENPMNIQEAQFGV